jgi:hypothetical protein
MENYKLTTFGEFSDENDLSNKTFILCQYCKALVADERGLKLIEIKDCPKCGNVLSVDVK